MTRNRDTGRLRRLLQRHDLRRRRRLRGRPAGAGADGRQPGPLITLMIVSLPGLAALAALLFTWMQVSQTRQELQIVQQGQITSRYNAAINNLGSSSVDVRLGGIYALERLMRDSSRDQPTVVSVLAAYVRQHAPAHADVAVVETRRPPADIEAVMNVLAERSMERDRDLVLDLSKTELSGWKPARPFTDTGTQLELADLSGSNLIKTDLSVANLRNAYLDEADFRDANLTGADLRDASLFEANLRDASLSGANASGAFFCYDRSAGASTPCPDMTATDFSGADLKRAALAGANLTKAQLCSTSLVVILDEETGEELETTERACATLAHADLSGANLAGMPLAQINLSGAKLINADLSGTNLSKANLTGADLTGADLSNANLAGARLAGAKHKGAKLNGTKGLPKGYR
ncbi:pentapeptide repeat-containing protein [Streptomyces sp. NBC_00299]|uniref:pentapeptide repeat-containing protein n=1 Tax=Streptomyces sp. NBC_00299 TaxID=2975705 RepID=UPI002E2D2846|nr:pentapeptide repeat-containing protein [Streptomyces sp. NBC_00299]